MRRHPIDLFSLLSGLVVLAFAIAYLVGGFADVQLDSRLVVPLLIVGLGTAGLAGALVAQRRANRRLDRLGPGPTA